MSEQAVKAPLFFPLSEMQIDDEKDGVRGSATKSRNLGFEQTVIVCRVENDCIVKSDKPIFYYSKSSKRIDIKDTLDEENSDDEEEESILTHNDLMDLNKAVSLVSPPNFSPG